MKNYKENLIYLCGNDGTDTRISKEVFTLSKKYQVIYIGIKSNTPFRHKYLNYKLFKGSHKNIFTLIKMNLYLFYILFFKKIKINRIHVVDEQFYLFFIPLLSLFKMHITLDIFDSIFLKFSLPRNKFLLAKKIIYNSCNRLIVTDENRFNLMPEFAKKITSILPNVPFENKKFIEPKPIIKSSLVIAYFGTLAKNRGSEFIKKLIDANRNVKILVAGWVTDDFTNSLIVDNPKIIQFLGTINQNEANKLLYEKCHYLICVYPFDNINNIYASPNKIYDAIQTRTPVIMNDEIIASDFVKKNNIGFTFSSKNLDFVKINLELIKNKNKLLNNNELHNKFVWDNYEKILID